MTKMEVLIPMNTAIAKEFEIGCVPSYGYRRKFTIVDSGGTRIC